MTKDERTRLLREFCLRHKINAPLLAELCDVQRQTARAWLCGSRVIPKGRLHGLLLTRRERLP